MYCAVKHAWDGCDCPENDVVGRGTRWTAGTVFLAVAAGLFLLMLLDCVDSEVF